MRVEKVKKEEVKEELSRGNVSASSAPAVPYEQGDWGEPEETTTSYMIDAEEVIAAAAEASMKPGTELGDVKSQTQHAEAC